MDREEQIASNIMGLRNMIDNLQDDRCDQQKQIAALKAKCPDCEKDWLADIDEYRQACFKANKEITALKAEHGRMVSFMIKLNNCPAHVGLANKMIYECWPRTSSDPKREEKRCTQCWREALK